MNMRLRKTGWSLFGGGVKVDESQTEAIGYMVYGRGREGVQWGEGTIAFQKTGGKFSKK